VKILLATISIIALSTPSFAQTAPATLNSTRALVTDQRYADARPAAQALVAADATSAAAHDLLGQCLWRTEKPDADAAVKELTQAVTLDPQTASYQSDLGDAYMARFIIGLRDWVKDHPGDMVGSITSSVPGTLAGGTFGMGRMNPDLFSQQTDMVRSSAQMQPADWARLESGVKSALKAYNAALAVDQANKPALHGKGLASLMLGEWKDTVSAWKAGGVPAFDSFLWDIARNVTDAHGKGPESIDIWEMVSQAQPANPWAYWNLRALYDEFRHSDWKYGYYDAMRMLFANQISNESDAQKPSPKDALKGLKDVTDKHPEYAPAWRGTGMTLLVLKDKKGAAEAFAKAVAADPTDGYSFLMLGVGQLAGGNAQAAQASLAKAAKYRPEDATAWNALGAAAEKNEDLDGAEMYYQRAVELAPNWPDARFSLGSILLDRRKGAEALPHLQRYVELVPDAKNVKDVKKAIEQVKEILAKQNK
jgi:tetratricopeptide (TPR) repeat protein